MTSSHSAMICHVKIRIAKHCEKSAKRCDNTIMDYFSFFFYLSTPLRVRPFNQLMRRWYATQENCDLVSQSVTNQSSTQCDRPSSTSKTILPPSRKRAKVPVAQNTAAESLRISDPPNPHLPRSAEIGWTWNWGLHRQCGNEESKTHQPILIHLKAEADLLLSHFFGHWSETLRVSFAFSPRFPNQTRQVEKASDVNDGSTWTLNLNTKNWVHYYPINELDIRQLMMFPLCLNHITQISSASVKPKTSPLLLE